MPVTIPTEFITLDFLLSFPGMVAVVYLVVRFSKSLVKRVFPDNIVRLYALFVTCLLQTYVLLVRNGWTGEAAGLALINAIFVTLAAMGAQEMINDPWATKTKIDPNLLKIDLTKLPNGTQL